MPVRPELKHCQIVFCNDIFGCLFDDRNSDSGNEASCQMKLLS